MEEGVKIGSIHIMIEGLHKSAVQIQPTVLVKNLDVNQTAAILLGVYMQVAQEFLKQHPESCRDCESFKEHIKIVEYLGVVHNEHTNNYIKKNLFGEK